MHKLKILINVWIWSTIWNIYLFFNICLDLCSQANRITFAVLLSAECKKRIIWMIWSWKIHHHLTKRGNLISTSFGPCRTRTGLFNKSLKFCRNVWIFEGIEHYCSWAILCVYQFANLLYGRLLIDLWAENWLFVWKRA